MKIRKILEIKRVGIYRDFEWDDGLPSFSDFNLIYGWNYSGKTTLSRIFDALGKPQKNPSLRGFFKVEDEDGVVYSSDAAESPYNCKVFNRDFIDRNFQQEHNAPAVFVVGDDANRLHKKILRLEEHKSRVGRIASDLERKKVDWERRVNEGLKRNEARSIGELVSDRNFNRRNLDDLLFQVKGSLGEYILEDSDFDACKATANSNDQFVEQKNFFIPNVNIDKMAEEAEELIGQTASNNAIERLQNDPKLEAWVRSGRELHFEGDECGFCGNKIDARRFDLLKGHFSTEYEALVNEIARKIDSFRRLEMEVTLPESAQLIPSVRDEYSRVKERIIAYAECRKKIIPMLVELLERKISSIETSQALPQIIADALNEVESYSHSGLSQEVRNVLQLHNSQISDMEQTKAQARDRLKKHSAARFCRDSDILTEENLFKEIKENHKKTEGLNSKIQGKINDLEMEIKKYSVAVAKLNELIGVILYGSNISAVQLSESEFEFQRGTEKAVNLSDGERTAIAFSYFLLTIEEGGNDPGGTIIFIDDPISSLDSNHIYSIFSLITNRLKGKCKQLFVSTHNYEFLNFLKDESLNGKRNFKAGCSGYLAQRAHDEQGEPFAKLAEMPIELRRFKSEYQFLFSLLYNFSSSEDATLHEAYTSPTILRKFLETYLGFRNPAAGRWSDKLNILFENEVDRKEIAKFADDASHLQSLKQAVEHGEYISSAQSIVHKVFNAIEQRDNAHFLGLSNLMKG